MSMDHEDKICGLWIAVCLSTVGLNLALAWGFHAAFHEELQQAYGLMQQAQRMQTRFAEDQQRLSTHLVNASEVLVQSEEQRTRWAEAIYHQLQANRQALDAWKSVTIETVRVSHPTTTE